MTKKEYELICEIIDKQIKTEWISANYQKQSIPMHGVTIIKAEIEKLVKK